MSSRTEGAEGAEEGAAAVIAVGLTMMGWLGCGASLNMLVSSSSSVSGGGGRGGGALSPPGRGGRGGA